MPKSNHRLPGIWFTNKVPKIAEALPRMDIAGFVGFASTGPVNKPTVVEDIKSFRSIFGEDVVLAWDGERGKKHYSYLGQAVESFFDNGGRRCWIVRINTQTSDFTALLQETTEPAKPLLFSAKPFLDEHLANTGIRNLLQEAEHKKYVRLEQLNGIHSLLFIDEVTLVAVPDAVHRSWTMDIKQQSNILKAPELNHIPKPDSFKRYNLTWSKVSGATAYLVQRSDSPDFLKPNNYYVDKAAIYKFSQPHPSDKPLTTNLSISLICECSKTQYFRVRAERYGEVGPWSNTRGEILPRQDFAICKKPEPENLEIRLHSTKIGAPVKSYLLSWEAWQDDNYKPAEGDEYEVQQATNAGFFSPQELYRDSETQIEIPFQKNIALYYRARVWRSDTAGPWSNTIAIIPESLSRYTLEAIDKYKDRELIKIHNALIRLCATRGDMLALLSLPRHYRDQDVLNHIKSLRKDQDDQFASKDYIDERKLSYGALYHPWIALEAKNLFQTREPVIRYHPPDGVVAGTMAKRTIAEGAWMAPANQPLSGVLAIDPDFTIKEWGELIAKQVNIIRREPQGFVVLNSDTLCYEKELRNINVRRLMSLLRRLVLREGNRYVFEPNNSDFRDIVQHYFEQLLSDLYLRGALAGGNSDTAYRVVTDSSVNTQRTLDLGRFIVELQVAPSRPLDFINIRLMQSSAGQTVIQEL